MDKNYKPIPDMDCLKYHGTEEHPDIKIFVSHRIDLESKIVDNPYFIPVRCGAIFDPKENPQLLGDDTGDNISERRMSFNELTVIYWAWKNIKADYYGLCHYRRYFSFLDRDLPGFSLKHGIMKSMSTTTLGKCGLLNKENMEEQLKRLDGVIPYFYNLKDVPDFENKSIKDAWFKAHPSYLRAEHFELLRKLVEKHSPEYLSSADQILSGKNFCGFNCFILKKDIFYKLCEFMFPIIFEFAESINEEHFSEFGHRAPAYLGEWLTTIFFNKVKQERKLEEHQLIFFNDTSAYKPLKPAFETGNIPVVLTATDFKRDILGVQLQSIIENAREDNNYDIIVLNRSEDGNKFGAYLKKEANNSLKAQLQGKNNFSLRFYNPCEELLELDYTEFGQDNREEEWYPLLLPWIFKEYNRIIALQPSVIVNHDVAELYQEDLQGKVVGATRDFFFAIRMNNYQGGVPQEQKQRLKGLDLYRFASTEVLLMDLQRLRENLEPQQIISQVKAKGFPVVTQEGFNYIYSQYIALLPQHWNRRGVFSPEYFYWMEESIPKEIYQKDNKQDWILNLKGPENQWLLPETKGMKLFWSYARHTEFYEGLFLSLNGGITSEIPKSGIRALTDELLPKGSRRREFVKKLIPRGSRRWNFCKWLYFKLKGK